LCASNERKPSLRPEQDSDRTCRSYWSQRETR
jgi:hypothetical protein